MRKNIAQSGFTLIELLVVIAVISLLSSVVFASLRSARMKARDSRRIADLKQIQVALELFLQDKGYYPRSSCTWDCGDYLYSYDSSWNILAADLAPYIPALPKDPINSSCPPWNVGCYSYTYGNVGRTQYPATYDLTTQLEDTSNPQRCEVKGWRFSFEDSYWCTAFGGFYSNQIYEASLD